MNDREMILNRGRWSGETLCLKRRPREGEKAGFMGYAAFGVILTARNSPIVVYLRGEDPSQDFKRTATYDSVDALLEAGWIVD